MEQQQHLLHQRACSASTMHAFTHYRTVFQSSSYWRQASLSACQAQAVKPYTAETVISPAGDITARRRPRRQNSSVIHHLQDDSYAPQQQTRQPLQQPCGVSVPAAATYADWQLTQMIVSAKHWQDVANILSQNKHCITGIHVAAALSRLAKLAHMPLQQQQQQQQRQRQQQHASSVFDDIHSYTARVLLPVLLHHASAMGARGLANATWALAKLQVLPQPHVLQLLLTHVEAAVTQMEPQHISSVLYAVALWQQQGQQQQQHGWQQQQFAVPETAIGSSNGGSRRRLYTHQRQQSQAVPAAAAWDSSSSMANSSPAAARSALGVPASLMDALLIAAAVNMGSFGPQALSNTMYAAAVLEAHLSPSFIEAFWEASSSKMATAEPQHVSNMLWAVAKLGLPPPCSWVSAALAASAAVMAATAPQGISNSIWAVAKLGWGNAAVQPLHHIPSSSSSNASGSSSSSWLQCFLHASGAQLDAFSDQGLTNCCWALGRIAQQQQQQQLQMLLQDHPGWQQRLLAVLQPRLLGFSPQQLSNTVWGLATCGVQPSEAWLASYVRASGPKLLGFKPHEASSTLVALAKLNHHPGRAWLSLYETAVGRHISNSSSQVISNSMWAMQLLQHRPSEAWMQLLLPEICKRMQLPLATEESGSSSSSCVAFTPQGLSVLLLCLAKYTVAAAGSKDSLLLPGDFWRLAAQKLLQQQQHGIAATDADGSSSSSVLSQFTPQGLAYVAGAVVSSAANELIAQRLVAAVMDELALQQQQQRVKLADAAMVLWAAARLQLQPPAEHVAALADVALQELQSSSSSSDCASPAAAAFGPGCKMLGAMMYALGVIGFHPGSAWFKVWFYETAPLLNRCSSWTLAMLLWGSLWLEQIPTKDWLLQWKAAWQQQQCSVEQQQQQCSVEQQQQHATVQCVVAAAARLGLRALRITAAAVLGPDMCSSSMCGSVADRWECYRLCKLLLRNNRQRRQLL